MFSDALRSGWSVSELRHVADPASCARRQPNGILAEYPDGPRRRPKRAGDQAEARRLAGTRWPDDTEDGPSRDADGDLVEGDLVVKTARELVGDDRGIRGIVWTGHQRMVDCRWSRGP